jgi:hypothetical protein
MATPRTEGSAMRIRHGGDVIKLVSGDAQNRLFLCAMRAVR